MTETDLKDRIAARLLEARTESGKSRSEVAALLGLSESSVGNWERAYRIPDRETIDQLSRIYMKSAAWLFCMDDNHVIEGEAVPEILRNLGADYIALVESAKDAELTPEQLQKMAELIISLKK